MLRMRIWSSGFSSLRTLIRSRPLRPGMEMSSMTTPQLRSRTCSKTSLPLAASPSTQMSSVSASICFRPWRMMVWSSANNTSIFCIVILLVFVKWHCCLNQSACARCGDYGEASMQNLYPFAHPDQTDAGMALFRQPKAATVVADGEDPALVGQPKIDFHLAGLGVAGDVGQ